MKEVGVPAFVITISAVPVHSGVKIALLVRVKYSDGPRFITPLEGRVNGVQ